MILPTGNKKRIEKSATGGTSSASPRRGFTLIELVLVMAILIVVLSVSGTSLTRFFRGRSLDSEAKRFLALTHHAQNRAVSEGLRMSLWIDEKENKYGLEIAPGLLDEEDSEAKEFTLGRDLEIELTWPPAGAIQPFHPLAAVASTVNRANQTALRFSPDEYIDETNPELITIKEKDGEAVYIAPDRNRLHYEIVTNIYDVLR